MTYSGEREPIRSDKAPWRREKRRKVKPTTTTPGGGTRREALLADLLTRREAQRETQR